MQVFLNGKFLPAEEAHISIFDHGFLYGDGVYETLRTVNGDIFDFHAHFQRFLSSAKELDLHIPFSEDEVFQIIEELLEKNTSGRNAEARIRWTLTRGENSFHFTKNYSPTFLVTVRELPPYPKKIFSNGVTVSCMRANRFLPEVKSISLIPMVAGKQKSKQDETFECLFVENGFITEGTVSNFFVLCEGVVWTSPEKRILSGTAAKIFKKKLAAENIPVLEKDFSPEEVIAFGEEAFLTNSLFGLLSVVQMEGENIGDGKPGATYQKIVENFWEI